MTAFAAANESGSLGRISTGELDTTHGAVLYLEEISVSFDGFQALDKLSLSIDVGELRCVIGPNGAGKTTMMDVITGKTRADAGTAFFGQTIDLARMSEAQIAHAGIGRKFQKPTIFENHTVFENVELAMKADKKARSTLFARLSSAQRDALNENLKFIRLDHCAGRLAGELSHGQKQWLEIYMLLMQEPRLLLLDEPFHGLDQTNRDALVDTLRALKQQGVAVLVSTHDLELAKLVCDSVVLVNGTQLAFGPVADVLTLGNVQECFDGVEVELDEHTLVVPGHEGH
jgi:urea transport system ATP-binding protein